jgi:hypothetical protein
VHIVPRIRYPLEYSLGEVLQQCIRALADSFAPVGTPGVNLMLMLGAQLVVTLGNTNMQRARRSSRRGLALFPPLLLPSLQLQRGGCARTRSNRTVPPPDSDLGKGEGGLPWPNLRWGGKVVEDVLDAAYISSSACRSSSQTRRPVARTTNHRGALPRPEDLQPAAGGEVGRDRAINASWGAVLKVHLDP